MRSKFERFESLEESVHNKMMDLFRKYSVKIRKNPAKFNRNNYMKNRTRKASASEGL